MWHHKPVHFNHAHFFLLVSASARACVPSNCPCLPSGLAWLLWRHDPVLTHAYPFCSSSWTPSWGCVLPYCPHLPRGLAWLMWHHKPVHFNHAHFFLLVSASARACVPSNCPCLPSGLTWLLWRHNPVHLTPAYLFLILGSIMKLCSAILSSPATWSGLTIVTSWPYPSYPCLFLSQSRLQHESVCRHIVLNCHVVWPDCCDVTTLSTLLPHIKEKHGQATAWTRQSG